MKLKENMYVRTERGKIAKIISKEDMSGSLHQECWVWKLDDLSTLAINSQKVTKTSYNLIDLIEVGDYVNGYIVTTGNENVGSIYIDKLDSTGTKVKLYNLDIKSVVTKEQFKQMEYEVDD